MRWDDDEGSTSAAAPESSAAAAPESSAAAPRVVGRSTESSRQASPPRRRVVRSRVDGRRGAFVTQGTTKLASAPGDEKGSLEVFDWQGYEDTAGCPDSCYGFWDLYVNGPYGKSNPLKFTFLEDDQQALAKVAAGLQDRRHPPCIAYTRSWHEAGLIQPWDVTAITGFDTIAPKLYQAGVIDGEIYAIPWDWGYSSLVYRSDKVQPEEE